MCYSQLDGGLDEGYAHFAYACRFPRLLHGAQLIRKCPLQRSQLIKGSFNNLSSSPAGCHPPTTFLTMAKGKKSSQSKQPCK